MKKIIVWLLLAAMPLGLFGCAEGPATQEHALPAQTVQETSAPETREPPVETTAAVSENPLFLKVSSIMFSVVGEQDDIYLEILPRDQVTWESEDPSIVSVENGVLTANGTGTTTVHASYGDKTVSCTAGCLAETQEELITLDPEILSAPKRLPPEVDLEEPCTYFDNAALVGDSISYFLFQWESKTDYLGDLLFLARGGVSMSGFVHHSKNIYYKGREMNLEDAIAKSQVERVYFLMGSNDISASTQRPYLFDNWNIMLERIREASPDVELVLLSNIPLYGDSQEASQTRFRDYNARIMDYNGKLKQFAEENDCLYLDLCYYVQDHNGIMPKVYNQGSYHMNEAGCLNWMKILRHYAQFESEGGTLS